VALSASDCARRVRLLVCDVDGVLTDGSVYYGPEGEALKRFHFRDGQGLALMRAAGIEIAWVTRERSPIVERRAEQLRITDLEQGASDKGTVMTELLRRKGITAAETCYIGDDLGDLAPMRMVGLAVAVADAVAEVRDMAHHVTRAPGGEGAVREVCDLILLALGQDSAEVFERATGRGEQRLT
jgi:3-deoxy-D-manno-octulosonate 8-phosphate phosphatase (KDO 8-P phosphatase)